MSVSSRFSQSTCPFCSGEMTRRERSIRLCTCGFQICHWCLSKVLQDGDSCPNCERSYSKDVIRILDNYSDSQLSDESSGRSDDLECHRNNNQKSTSQHSYTEIQYLQGVRIIQRDLVYVIGLAPHLAVEMTLRSPQLFGKYGSIKKVILNINPQLIEKVHSCCAYITYSTPSQALACIMAVDGVILQGSQIRASFGTTKYCNYYLRGIHCTNAECMYLHHVAKDDDCFTKKEMQTRQGEFYAKTHPCNIEMGDIPAGDSVDSLPAIKQEPSSPLVTNNSPSSALRSVMPATFGDMNGGRIDLSILLCDNISLNSSLCCGGQTSDDKEYNCMTEVFGDENLYIPSTSSTAIDVDFLLKADDYIDRIRKHNGRSKDCVSWDWRNMQRSNSIDSNVPVEI